MRDIDQYLQRIFGNGLYVPDQHSFSISQPKISSILLIASIGTEKRGELPDSL